jgi:hypothetical protein
MGYLDASEKWSDHQKKLVRKRSPLLRVLRARLSCHWTTGSGWDDLSPAVQQRRTLHLCSTWLAWVEPMAITRSSIRKVSSLGKVKVLREPMQHWGGAQETQYRSECFRQLKLCPHVNTQALTVLGSLLHKDCKQLRENSRTNCCTHNHIPAPCCRLLIT